MAHLSSFKTEFLVENKNQMDDAVILDKAKPFKRLVKVLSNFEYLAADQNSH